MEEETCSSVTAGVTQRITLKIHDKTASTNSITFAAIDPKRADNKMFELFFEPLDANGAYVTKSDADTVAWS